SSPGCQPSASGPVAATTPDTSWQGMAGQLSGQVSSSAVIAVARTCTSSSPGPGSGTGMLSLVRLAGSEFDAGMAGIDGTASFMDRVLPLLRDRSLLSR